MRLRATYWMRLMMKLFKRPDEKYTEEEYDDMRKKVQDLNLTRKEERILIFHALKTLMPGVILTLLVIWSAIIIILLLIG